MNHHAPHGSAPAPTRPERVAGLTYGWLWWQHCKATRYVDGKLAEVALVEDPGARSVMAAETLCELADEVASLQEAMRKKRWFLVGLGGAL